MATFERQLDESLRIWQAESVRGVWLRLPPQPQFAEMIAPALRRGFAYHHAEPAEGVTLVRVVGSFFRILLAAPP